MQKSLDSELTLSDLEFQNFMMPLNIRKFQLALEADDERDAIMPVALAC